MSERRRALPAVAPGSLPRWRFGAPEHAQDESAQPAGGLGGLRRPRLGLVVTGEWSTEAPVPPAPAAVADIVRHRRQLLSRFTGPLGLGHCVPSAGEVDGVVVAADDPALGRDDDP
jgi:hypothetical protein